MFRFGGAAHYTVHGIKWIFSAFCKYMELDRAKTNLALVFIDNYNTEPPFIP